MTEEFIRQALATSVAQMCSNIGWHSMSGSTLQMMTDILYDYFKDLSRSVKKFSEISDSITPDIWDVNMAFRDKGVSIPDLVKYLKQVEPVKFPHQVPKFPVPKKSNLNIMKPGSREIVTRPVYIHEHLPTLFPEESDKNTSQDESCSNQAVNSSSSLGIFNNDTQNFQETETSKSDGTIKEKMVTHRQLREISSVVMTTSGFLSPSREGKLPESRLKPISNLKANSGPIVEQLSNPKLLKEVKDLTQVKKLTQKVSNSNKEKEKSVVVMNNTNNLNANISIKNEDPKVKKFKNSKEPSKLKPLKKEAVCELNQETRKKPPKIKNKSKSSLLNTIFDKPTQVKNPKKATGEKLTTEPNNQKLNIFKKISKIKDDKNNELNAGIPSSKSNVSIISKPNSTVVSSDVSVKTDTNPEVIEEKPFKPVFFKTPVEKNLDSKSPIKETIEELSSEINKKRKKKQKIPANDLKSTSLDTTNNDTGTKKSKTKHDSEIYSKFSFFGPLTSGLLQPGTSLLPPSLASNPLVPKYTAPNRVLPILEKASAINSMMYLPLPAEDNIDESKLNLSSSSINSEKEKVPVEKIKPKKGHKKIKKDKIKSKKKKDKKDKFKEKTSKSERKKEKLLKKKKCLDIKELKQEPVILENKEESITNEDSLVPKIKLKLTGSTDSVDQRKIVIKTVKKNKSSDFESNLRHLAEETLSVEQSKSSVSKSKINAREKNSTLILPNPVKQEDMSIVLNSKSSNSKKSVVDIPSLPLTSENMTLPFSSDSIPVTSGNKNKTKTSKKMKKTLSQTQPPFYFDESGNQVWICPTCTKKDDGSPMIGCDGCDAWYHWVCVGIQCPPDCAVWYCPKCLRERAERGGTTLSVEKNKRETIRQC